MKTYFKSNEIAHIWAHKSAPCGKSPGAMSFNGDSFYSYGTVIARHIERNGKRAIILNDTGYSVSTTKHQNIVRSAIPETVPKFHIGGIGRGASLDFYGNEGKHLFDYAIKHSAECLKLADRARTHKARHQNAAAVWLDRAKEINEFFGLRRKVDEKAIERLRLSAEKAEREAEKKRLAEEEKRRIEQTAAFEAWKRGEGSVYEFNPSLFPVAFRIEEDELVSSKGARVPVKAAKAALRFVLSRRESGWHRNGETCEVGNYHLDAINAQGIVAGCHRITWEEIARITPLLA